MVTQTGQEMCLCFCSSQHPESLRLCSEKENDAGGERKGNNETVLGITLTRKDFFNIVLVNEVK